jgi:hypothetical protein
MEKCSSGVMDNKGLEKLPRIQPCSIYPMDHRNAIEKDNRKDRDRVAQSGPPFAFFVQTLRSLRFEKPKPHVREASSNETNWTH